MPLQPGDQFVAALDENDVTGTCTLEECRPFDRLRLRWRWPGEPDSVVTATIGADGAESTLQVQHTRLSPELAADYGGGWQGLLASLQALLGEPDAEESADPADWTAMVAAGLELEHTFAASPDRVWAAFTDPEVLGRWWWSHWSDVQVGLDPTPGGRYRIEAPAAGITVSGTFLEVSPTDHLAFTWIWSDADGGSRDEACDLRFEPTPTGTRLILRHTGPWSDGSAATSYAQGWDFTLGALDRLLAES